MVLGLLLRLSPPKENLTKSLCGEVVRAWRCESFRSFNTYKIYCLLSVLSVYVCCVHLSLPVHVPMLVHRGHQVLSVSTLLPETRPPPHPISQFGGWEASAVQAEALSIQVCVLPCLALCLGARVVHTGPCACSALFPLSLIPDSVFSF